MISYRGSASQVGFGDTASPSAFGYFRAQRDAASGVYPDWEQELISTTRHIPGSSRNDTYISGFGLATLTLSVWFGDRDAYRKIRAMHGTTNTLRLLALFTSQDGPVQHILDNDYEEFADTTLIGIGRVLHQVGGRVETTLTFQRGFDPVTGLGVT